MVEDYLVRPMKLCDIDEVYKLGSAEAAFEVAGAVFWSKGQLERWVENSEQTGDVLLVAEKEGEVAGYLLSRIHKQTGKVDVENVYVKDSHRRKGIASKMIITCEQAMKGKSDELFFNFLSKMGNIGDVLKKVGYSKDEHWDWYIK
jgi:ribosomal protein S18 acetylase RimI-like enzyme